MITLKTLPQATAQEVYIQVKTHLLAQNCRSVDGRGCLYRGPNGTKCAAGSLIGDDEYKECMERNSWGILVSRGEVPLAYKLLIQVLQTVHDNYEVERWSKELEIIALRYNLVP
jgi:hypothetical protein